MTDRRLDVEWNLLCEGEEEYCAKALAKICAHFMNALPSLLRDLRYPSSVAVHPHSSRTSAVLQVALQQFHHKPLPGARQGGNLLHQLLQSGSRASFHVPDRLMS
jgi:hypothetical protein